LDCLVRLDPFRHLRSPPDGDIAAGLQGPELAFLDAIPGGLQTFFLLQEQDSLPQKSFDFFYLLGCRSIGLPSSLHAEDSDIPEGGGWEMPKAGDCGSSGGGNCGGPRTGDGKDLSLLLLRVGAAVTLTVAGLFFSLRPRQLLLPPPLSGKIQAMIRLKPAASSFQKLRENKKRISLVPINCQLCLCLG
jgi:hypothetical protein